MLNGQHPARNKKHGAGEAVEVVSYDDHEPVRAAHDGVDLLEEGQGTLIGCNTRCNRHVHVIYVFI